MRVFIGSAQTPVTDLTKVQYKRMIDASGSCSLQIADNEFSAYNTYKASHFDTLTIVADDWDAEYVYNYDNTSGFTDQTSEAASDAADDVNLTGKTGAAEVGDILYVGRDEAFGYIRVDISTINSDNSYAIEYWDGDSWEAPDPVEFNTTEGGNSESFEQDGIITWARPSDWSATTVDGQSAFWMRFRVTSAGSAKPTAARINAGELKFEGRVADVDLDRNVTALVGRTLDVELDDITLAHTSSLTANFSKQDGIIYATDSGAKSVTDSGKSWTNNEFTNDAFLVTPKPLTLNSYGAWSIIPVLSTEDFSHHLHNATHSGNTEDYHLVMEGHQQDQGPVLGFHFRGTSGDLDAFTVHFKYRLSNESAEGELQVYDAQTHTAWELIADSASASGQWVEDSTALPGSLNDYFDSNGKIQIRMIVDDNGTAVEGSLWKVEVDYLYITWTINSRYDASNNTLFEIQSNDTNTVILDVDPESKNVQKGDTYNIGTRLDTAVEQIFSDYSSSLNLRVEIPQINKYTAQDFSGSKGLQAIRKLVELGGAHSWLGKGRVFRVQDSYTSSGVTIDETMVDPRTIRISLPEANFMKTATAVGSPEREVTATKTSAGSALRGVLLQLRNIFNQTELQSATDTAITRMDTESAVPNVLCPIFLQSANIRKLDIGQTVDLKLDVDADSSDEVDEDDIIIYSIEEEQEVGMPLKTTIQLGFYPIDESERLLKSLGQDQIRTNMHAQGRNDIYQERYLGVESGIPPKPATVDQIQNVDAIYHDWFWRDNVVKIAADYTNNADDILVLGDSTNPGAIDILGGPDAYFNRGGVPKFQGGASTITLGTNANDEDIDGFGDLDISAGSGDLDMNIVSIDGGDLFTVDNNDWTMRPHGTGGIQFGTGGNPADADGTGDVTADDDLDADDDLIFGSNAFTLVDDGSGNAKFNTQFGVLITSTDGESVGISLYEGAGAAFELFWDKNNNKAILESNGIFDFNSDLEVAGNIDLSTDAKGIYPNSNNTGEIGASGTYWGEGYFGDLHYVTIDASPWDDLGDLDIIDSMIHGDGIERMPDIIKDETKKFVMPNKKDKLMFGAIRELRKENKELKELIMNLQQRLDN